MNKTFVIQYGKVKQLLLNNHIYLRKFEASPNTDDAYLKINSDISIEPHCAFYSGIDSLNSMGAFSYTNSTLGENIKIGRYCCIGSGLRIMGAEHFTDWISTSPYFYRKGFFNPIEISKDVSHTARSIRNINIGHDVWIGENVTLKKTCTIGNGAIIAAGSVVTRNVEPFTIIGGNPAKLIRPRFDKQIVQKILDLEWWRFHANELGSLDANNPKKFLSGLESKIISNEIKPYMPDTLSANELLPFFNS